MRQIANARPITSQKIVARTGRGQSLIAMPSNLPPVTFWLKSRSSAFGDREPN
jgi:hypothetical protein